MVRLTTFLQVSVKIYQFTHILVQHVLEANERNGESRRRTAAGSEYLGHEGGDYAAGEATTKATARPSRRRVPEGRRRTRRWRKSARPSGPVPRTPPRPRPRT